MPRNVTCDWMNLSFGIEELLSDIHPELKSGAATEVKKAGRKAAKKLREEAGERWDGITGSRYSAGFSSTAKGLGDSVSSEVGNRAAPGLVHLLEKGHVTLAGRRTQAYPHMAPVFDEVSEELYEKLLKVVSRALEG